MDSLQNIPQQLTAALEELQAVANFKTGQLIVVGCSSSEVLGSKIGSATNMEAARMMLPVMMAWARQHQLYLAVQCCEHLNRCLVVEAECVQAYGLDEVNVIPYEKGGGALGAAAMELFARPLTVESLRHQAHGGLDIGNTFIGMHLRPVAVCVRLNVTHVGAATLNCVRTRLPLIGGPRAKHHTF